MLINPPAVFSTYGRNIINILGSTFLVENDFNFQNELRPYDFKITKHSCLRLKWKVTNLSPMPLIS